MKYELVNIENEVRIYFEILTRSFLKVLSKTKNLMSTGFQAKI
jgi:hypothetical protein